MESGKSSQTALGLSENVEGLLCYLFGALSGILFLVLETKSQFVRFHAIQSIGVFGVLWILQWILIPMLLVFLLGPGIMILWILEIALWIFLMYKAYNGERYKIPIIGSFAETQANK